MYYRENDKIIDGNIEHYGNYESTDIDEGNQYEISAKIIGLYILYILLAVVILLPIIFKNTASWIFETNEKKGFSLILILIITILVLNYSF